MTDISNHNNEDRLVRLNEVLALLPISKSTWWQGVRAGRFPRPVKLGSRVTCWKLSAIRTLLDKGI
jgi:prophage regulatory protein